MKKNFKFYALIWIIMLAAFNAVVFLVRPVIPGYVINYDARFWIAWGFILAAFIGNLVCAYFAFKAENLKKMFLNLPLITVSWSALIAMLVVGSGLMLIPNCPAWIAAIVCIVVLAFNANAVIKAAWAADTVNKVDEKVKVQTSYIKNLTVDTESILARAKSEPVKAECKKVYEAVRYSDPMSNDALSVIEAKITVKVDEFASAVGADDAEKVKEIADDIVILIGDRNKKCKLLK
ncbi:MAG: hypothetical protein IJU20_03200 [Clostridia bacterium]|nr:hypothetical protein [Clostridia bacterium]